MKRIETKDLHQQEENYRIVRSYLTMSLEDVTGYEMFSDCIEVENYTLDDFRQLKDAELRITNTLNGEKGYKSIRLKYQAYGDKFLLGGETDWEYLNAKNIQTSGLLDVVKELHGLRLFVAKYQDLFGVRPELDTIQILAYEEESEKILATSNASENVRMWLLQDDELCVMDSKTNSWKSVNW